MCVLNAIQYMEIEMAPKKEVYDSSSIMVLEGLEPVRERPGMYIGSTSTKGLNHLVYEIMDNSVDEHMAGYCDTITVTLNADGSATVNSIMTFIKTQVVFTVSEVR